MRKLLCLRLVLLLAVPALAQTPLAERTAVVAPSEEIRQESLLMLPLVFSDLSKVEAMTLIVKYDPRAFEPQPPYYTVSGLLQEHRGADIDDDSQPLGKGKWYRVAFPAEPGVLRVVCWLAGENGNRPDWGQVGTVFLRVKSGAPAVTTVEVSGGSGDINLNEEAEFRTSRTLLTIKPALTPPSTQPAK